MKRVVFAWGRFNPPTIGHEKLLQAVEKIAAGDDFLIYPTHTQDKKKNPLDSKTKSDVMKKMFPSMSSNIVYDPNINNQKDVDDLGLYGATYIGDVYYDESSGTYYDEQGKIHENRYFNWQCMCYRWSFSRWWSNLGSDFKGTAVDRIGSGFVIKGKASGSGGLNTRSNHPEDDIEIPEEVINALKGITGKFKGATGRKKVSL